MAVVLAETGQRKNELDPKAKSLGQELSRQRLSALFVFPDIRVNDPPACAVPIQFQAVHGMALPRSIRREPLLCCAQDMRDVAGSVRDTMNFMFVKCFALHRRFAFVHKILM